MTASTPDDPGPRQQPLTRTRRQAQAARRASTRTSRGENASLQATDCQAPVPGREPEVLTPEEAVAHIDAIFATNAPARPEPKTRSKRPAVDEQPRRPSDADSAAGSARREAAASEAPERRPARRTAGSTATPSAKAVMADSAAGRGEGATGAAGRPVKAGTGSKLSTRSGRPAKGSAPQTAVSTAADSTAGTAHPGSRRARTGANTGIGKPTDAPAADGPSLSSLAPAPGVPARHGSVGHAPVAATRSVDATEADRGATRARAGKVVDGAAAGAAGAAKASATRGRARGQASAQTIAPAAYLLGAEDARNAETAPPAAAAESPAEPPESQAVPATAEAFDGLCTATAGRLTWQTYLLTAHRHRAAHCVRRAFQLAWTNWDVVSADDSPEGWVRATAFELALSPWHSGGPRMQHLMRLPHRRLRTPDAQENLSQRDKALLVAVMRLPRPQRRALVLHDVIGLDWAQTASEVEGSTPVAFGRVARAREALARTVPGIVGADPEQPGFGRRLGVQLQAAALRRCGADAPSEPPHRTRIRARLHDRGLTGAAGALTLVTASGLAAALAWGTPLHPAERPVITHGHQNGTSLALYTPAQPQPHQLPPTTPHPAAAAAYDPALAAARKAADHSGQNDNGGGGNHEPALCRLFALPCATHHSSHSSGGGGSHHKHH